MDRGLVVGGALICASFLIAVALNQWDGKKNKDVPKKAIEAASVESKVNTPLMNCPEPDEKALTPNPKQVAPECK